MMRLREKKKLADGRKYIYTDVYGLEGTDTFKVYLPGHR